MKNKNGYSKRKTDDELLGLECDGFKVMNLFYKEQNYYPFRRKFAKCLCACGKEFEVRSDSLLDRHGCRKCGNLYGGKSRIIPNFGAAKNNYYISYLSNSKSRNLNFSISRDHFESLIKQNCYFCGTPPSDQSYLSKSSLKYNKFYASGIDRLDNSLGYTYTNSVSCCTKCNMMKKVLSETEFINHINKIYEHYNKK